MTTGSTAELRGPGDILPFAAARFGGKTALVSGGRRLGFTELEELSARFAAGLATRGVRPGERVSLYAPNSWPWVVAYHGALRAGAVVNPVNVLLTPEELAFILRDCSSSAVVTSAARADAVRQLAPDLPELRLIIAVADGVDGTIGWEGLLADGGTVPDAAIAPAGPCTIGYTSGTTGHPKGAVQSHRAVLLNCAYAATMHGRTERDTTVTALPAPHVYGNIVVNGTFLAGGTVVLMERFAPGEALRLIGDEQATMFEGVPAMYAMLLADPALAGADLSTLTRCTVGGQTIPVATMQRWENRSGAPLIEVWGMTELAGMGTTHAVHAPPLPGSTGVSLPGVEVRVADLTEPGRTVPPGEPGELMVRGAIVMSGYHNNPEATAETIEPDGWLHTGDIATMTDDGHVFVIDRRKDMIITGGYNVYPAEVERVLAEHPAVTMVAVGPLPDSVMGETVCAYVVPRVDADVDEQALIDFTDGRLAPYKRPRHVHFVADLPKTSTGKIMRRELTKLPAAPD